MEDVIHSATSEDDVDSGMPIFKHIARKWMGDDKNIEYQVIVQPNMIEKANRFSHKIKEALHEVFGDEVLNHFPDSNQRLKNIISKNTTLGFKPTARDTYEDKDRELESMIIKNNKHDNFGKVFLEGMEMVKQEDKEENKEPPKALIINEGVESEGSSMSGMSGISGDSRSTNGGVHWEEDEKGKERTVESIAKQEREKIRVTE